jgi:hypothetical protein
MLSYKDAVRAQAKADLRGVHFGVHLIRDLGVAVCTAGVGIWLERNFKSELSVSGWLMPCMAGVVAVLLVNLGVRVFFRLRAPRKIYEADQQALAARREELESMKLDHMAAVSSLEAGYPRITASLREQKEEGENLLLLSIANEGGTATFYAKLHINGLGIEIPHGELFCQWNHLIGTGDTETTIPGGSSFSLRLAKRKTERGKRDAWYVQYTTYSGITGETVGMLVLGQPIEDRLAEVRLLIEIVGEPRIIGGKTRFCVGLNARGFRELPGDSS